MSGTQLQLTQKYLAEVFFKQKRVHFFFYVSFLMLSLSMRTSIIFFISKMKQRIIQKKEQILNYFFLRIQVYIIHYRKMSEVRAGVSRSTLHRSRGLVENNPVAKLMHYVDCVCFLFELEQTKELKKLTNFEDYKSLKAIQIKLLIEAATHFEPTKLIDKCIFLEPQTNQDFMNRFEEPDNVPYLQKKVPSKIQIQGEPHYVNKIMFCCLAWLEQYFILPVEELYKNKNPDTGNIELKKKSSFMRTHNQCCTIM